MGTQDRRSERVGAIIKSNGKVLLIRRNKKGTEYWVLIGGGVEQGESLEDALHREVFEEVGQRIVGFKFIDKHFDGTILHHFFEVEIEQGELVLGGPEAMENNPENSFEFVWVETKELKFLKLLYPTKLVELMR